MGTAEPRHAGAQLPAPAVISAIPIKLGSVVPGSGYGLNMVEGCRYRESNSDVEPEVSHLTC